MPARNVRAHDTDRFRVAKSLRTTSLTHDRPARVGSVSFSLLLLGEEDQARLVALRALYHATFCSGSTPLPFQLLLYTVLMLLTFTILCVLFLGVKDQALLVVLRVLRGICAALEDVRILQPFAEGQSPPPSVVVICGLTRTNPMDFYYVLLVVLRGRRPSTVGGLACPLVCNLLLKVNPPSSL